MTSAIEGTMEHAKLLARHLSHCDYAIIIHLVLCELSVAPKNEGFVFLKKAVSKHYENPLCNLQQDVYAKISLEIDGVENNRRVEQSIRRAIEDAWNTRNEAIWELIFLDPRGGSMERPSNGDFIAGVSWFVELCTGFCKEVAYEQRAEGFAGRV
jgi:hypothetical protein